MIDAQIKIFSCKHNSSQFHVMLYSELHLSACWEFTPRTYRPHGHVYAAAHLSIVPPLTVATWDVVIYMGLTVATWGTSSYTWLMTVMTVWVLVYILCPHTVIYACCYYPAVRSIFNTQVIVIIYHWLLPPQQCRSEHHSITKTSDIGWSPTEPPIMMDS